MVLRESYTPSVDPTLEAIKNMPKSTSANELRSFLETVNFVLHSSGWPRKTLLGAEMEKIKHFLTSETSLAPYDPEVSLVICGDAMTRG